MVVIPADELLALGNLPPSGSRVIEMGNKKNATGLYREFYEFKGLEYDCIDWNGEDGALVCDFGKPFTNEFWERVKDADLVTNFGCLEHVYTNPVQAWRNLARLSSKLGCKLAMVMPRPGHWEHHGVYQPYLEWYLEWLEGNGYTTLTCQPYMFRDRHTIVVHAVKSSVNTYFHPEGLVHITPVNKRVNPQEKAHG